mmetsp:Transcript_1503/g.4396  ORF Transcript_1503/g.4396 Transcript_1503/m.4396 type:complete len:543 (-) Transcript_1503:1108-2736(-)
MASGAGGDRPKSDWSAPAERLGGLAVERTADDDDRGFGGAHCLTVDETERLVEGLEEFALEDVGSKKWMKQHANLEKLNQQAHASARDKHDEFVLEAFLTFDKLGALVYDLILVETWRERVYPLLEDLICGAEEEANRSRSMRCYFVLYHEATVVNLLECLCYHAHAVGAIKDASLDLTDYCARRLAALHSRCSRFREATPARDPTETPAEYATKLKNRTAREELAEQALQIEFTVSVGCVALVRMVVEHVGELTVSAVSRIVDKHDFLLSVVPLIEHPPWTRARIGPPGEDGSKGKRVWQKLNNGDWRDVPHDRLLDVTKLEAQAWFALYWLTMHPEVRKRYGFDAYRKQTLMRARRFVNDVLLDQIPVLAEMQRFMDELSIVQAPEPTAMSDRQCLMQQVAAFQECITRGADYAAIAKRQIDEIWTAASMHDDDLKALVDVYAGDDVLGADGDDAPGTLDLDKLSAELETEKENKPTPPPPPPPPPRPPLGQSRDQWPVWPHLKHSVPPPPPPRLAPPPPPPIELYEDPPPPPNELRFAP